MLASCPSSDAWHCVLLLLPGLLLVGCYLQPSFPAYVCRTQKAPSTFPGGALSGPSLQCLVMHRSQEGLAGSVYRQCHVSVPVSWPGLPSLQRDQQQLREGGKWVPGSAQGLFSPQSGAGGWHSWAGDGALHTRTFLPCAWRPRPKTRNRTCIADYEFNLMSSKVLSNVGKGKSRLGVQLSGSTWASHA